MKRIIDLLLLPVAFVAAVVILTFDKRIWRVEN